MEPGKELDELIAERVLGWSKYFFHTNHWFWETKGNGAVPEIIARSGGITTDYTPPFSTDLNWAWQIFEQFPKPFHVELERDPIGLDWIVSITEPKGSEHMEFWKFYRQSAPTAAHAICLAALQAVGHSF